METALDRVFIEFSTRKLRQLFERIGVCVGRLNEEQIWWRGAENQNAVGNLLLHLQGNVRQWVIAAVGEQPDVRVRDREFATREGNSPAELLERLGQTLEEAIAVIEALTPERLATPVTVQQYNVTAMEAVLHVVVHFAEHTGQIIFATKAFTGEDLGFYRHLKTPATHAQKTP